MAHRQCNGVSGGALDARRALGAVPGGRARGSAGDLVVRDEVGHALDARALHDNVTNNIKIEVFKAGIANLTQAMHPTSDDRRRHHTAAPHGCT